ncbi:cytochrome P450 [Haloparvum alkalitolerans]|uniref:cytochrome P450 n=1 Tax=Haloparvum alkalitolerans TaxID=1042953 RepID=UPI003CEC9FD5
MQRQPPGPAGDPVLGSARRYADDPFRFLSACGAAYGDVVRFDLGPRETYMLTNPRDVERVLVSESNRYRKADLGDRAIDDLLGDGLLMSDGEMWERRRSLANPAFDMRRITGLGEMMAQQAETVVSEWEPGETVDVQLAFAQLTVRIIATAMFGVDADEETVRRVQESLEPLGARFEPDPRRVLLPDWAPTRENRAFDAAVAELESVVDDVLERRRGTARDPAADPAGDAGTAVTDPVTGESGMPMDLLSVLLRAREAGAVDDRGIRDELVTMLLAGHDTTALTLTYAFYLLSEHPAERERVEAGVDDVVGTGRPDAADARELTVVGNALDEAMRLYPPVYTLFRQPTVDVKHAGYRVPADALVMLPQWVVHRSDRWYDDPEAFDPGRWTPERSADRPRFAFFPFGGGPRHCIGRGFSLLEAKIILATVCSRYRLDYEGPALSLRGSLTMHPEGPVTMRVRER